MKYKVICKDVTSSIFTTALKKEFELEVTLHINDGWELQGGICLIPCTLSDGTTYVTVAQALIKKD